MKRKKAKRIERKWDYVLSIAEAVELGYRLGYRAARRKGRKV